MKLSKYIVEQILIDIINRSDMPQIKGDDIPEALRIFDKYGVPYNRLVAKTDDLKPIQNDYIKNKVDNIAKQIDSGTKMNSIFISDDNYIVDGHHRWLAYKKLSMPFISCIKVEYPKMSALALFNKVSDKIDEQVPLVFPDGTINGDPKGYSDEDLSKYREKERKLGGKAVNEKEELDEKYITTGKHFTAIRDLEDYDIKKGDNVKITGTDLNDGYYGVKNLRNNEEFRIYSLEFIKNFR